MNASPASPGIGFGRLAARLDMPSSDYFPAITIAQAADIKQKYWMVQAFQHKIKVRVKAVLASLGTSSALTFGYYGFANEVMKAVGVHGYGDAGRTVVQVLVDKYAAMGLSQSVLERLREYVFGVQAPAGP